MKCKEGNARLKRASRVCGYYFRRRPHLAWYGKSDKETWGQIWSLGLGSWAAIDCRPVSNVAINSGIE